MTTLINFFKLLRPLNLFILILICVTIKFGLINQFIIEPALSDFNFFLFLISTLLVTAAGYIINDIYDEKIDKINKNHKRIINKEINSKSAIIYYFLFNFRVYQNCRKNFIKCKSLIEIFFMVSNIFWTV